MAGLVVAAAGVENALLADAGSFLAVALLLGATRSLRAPEPDDAEVGWVRRLRRGLAYVGDRPALRRLLGTKAAAFVFFALVIPVEVVFAKQTLDAGDAKYQILCMEAIVKTLRQLDAAQRQLCLFESRE